MLGFRAAIELHRLLKVCLGNRTAVGAACERGENLLGAGVLLARLRGLTHKNPAAARRVAGGVRVVRAVDRDLVNGRPEARVPVHVVAGQIGLALGFEERGGIFQERDADLMRPRRDRHAHFQMRVHLLEILVALRRRDGERLDPFTIHQHLDLVRLAQALDLLVAVTGQANLNLILAVARERVGEQHAATRAGRQPLDVILLREIRREPIGVAARLAIRRTDGEPADLPGGGDVAVQQRGRKFAHGHVVEAMTRVVLRQQRRRVNVQREQIANHILILSAVEPAESFGASGGRILHRRAVERGGQFAYDFIVIFVRRPLLADGRHLPRAHFANDLFPLIGMLRDAIATEALQIQPTLLHVRIVAGDAILVHD